MFPLMGTKGENWELNVISLRLYSTLRSLGNVKKRVDPKTLSSNAEDLRDESCGRSTGREQREFPFILRQPVLQSSLPAGERTSLSAG
jgi:hypothetical protein